tara:strand:+ start:326 stop:574 length:249 start_codon:yes stop_codon:yes gene_type:complete
MKNFYQITNCLFNYHFMSKNIFYFLFTKFLNKKLINMKKFYKENSRYKNQKLNLCYKEKNKIKQKIIFSYELFNFKKKIISF